MKVILTSKSESRIAFRFWLPECKFWLPLHTVYTVPVTSETVYSLHCPGAASEAVYSIHCPVHI